MPRDLYPLFPEHRSCSMDGRTLLSPLYLPFSLPHRSFPLAGRVLLFLPVKEKRPPLNFISSLFVYFSTLLCSKITQRHCFCSLSPITSLQVPLWSNLTSYTQLSLGFPAFSLSALLASTSLQLINVWRPQSSVLGMFLLCPTPPRGISFVSRHWSRPVC